MFGAIAVSNRSVDEYVPIIGEAAAKSLVRLAQPLAGLRVLHLTSPAASGAVRSMLATSVPLMANLGLDVQWQQVRMPADAWAMDAEQRGALSGYEGRWDSRRDAEWITFNEANAELFDEDFDVVVVHHTGSVGILPALKRRLGKRPPGLWLWHSHRDYRSAQPEAWALIRENGAAFNASLYDFRGFIRDDAPTRRRFVLPPGVDPLGARAMSVATDAQEVVPGQRRTRRIARSLHGDAPPGPAPRRIHGAAGGDVAVEAHRQRPRLRGPLATLKEGRSALFADTPMDQAEAIIKLLYSPKTATRLGEHAHQEAVRHYLVTRTLERQLDVLGKLLKRRPRQS